jgi:hypothetical protein
MDGRTLVAELLVALDNIGSISNEALFGTVHLD